MTIEEFSAAIEVLQVGTGKTLTDREIEVWFQCLHDLRLDALRAAVKRYLCEGDDWPSISKIRKLASSAVHGEHITHGEAFNSMLSAVRQFGFYGKPAAKEQLDDLTWITVEALGGWQAVSDSPTDQRATLRAQFRMVYESLADRDERRRGLPESLRPQIGIVEPLRELPYVPKGIEE